jgi:hypothetical protein
MGYAIPVFTLLILVVFAVTQPRIFIIVTVSVVGLIAFLHLLGVPLSVTP